MISYKSQNWDEEWKNNYRYGTFVIIPPEPVFSIVNDLRRRHDPKSARIAPAHISLTMPLKHPLKSNQIKQIENVSVV